MKIFQIIFGSIIGFILAFIISFTGHFEWLFSFWFYLIIFSICLTFAKIHKKYKFFYITIGCSILIIFLIFLGIMGNSPIF